MSVIAVDRVLKVLEALAGTPEGIDLGSLAERLDLPMSATHRLLGTLTENGFVTQRPDSGAYALTPKLSQIAFRHLDLGLLPDAAQGVLDALARRTREYCRLAVVNEGELFWVARAQGATAGLRYQPPMGTGIVLHATATGKAWLASLPDAEALRIVFARGFTAGPQAGPNVIRDIDGLRRQLAAIRAGETAIAVEEGEAGTIAMATTFRESDEAGAPVAGTLSVAGPASRMAAERRPDIAEALAEAAAAMAAIWPVRRRQMTMAIPRIEAAGPLRRAGAQP